MTEAEQQTVRWICKTCGWIYDEAKGDPDSGIAPGTRFEDIPDDWYCPLCGVGKDDFITLEAYAAQKAAAPSPTQPRRARGKVGGEDAVVIVGSGIAGWTVAEKLRELDPERTIAMITADDGSVYPKPTLSMAIAQGRTPEDLVEMSGPDMAERLNVTLQANTRVLGIKPKQKRITTAKGNVKYAELVIAMGAGQTRLPLAGNAADDVLRVNDLHSYRKMREKLKHGPRHVTLIGAGLIGVEFAEDLHAGGHKVTMLDLGDQLLGRLIPPQLATRLNRAFAAHGIEFIPENSASEINSAGDRYRAVLRNGEVLETDLVISAAGLKPNSTLAEKADLATNRGIIANKNTMLTSDPHIYAVGDCAEIEGRSYFYIEPIKRQAFSAAASIAGVPAPFELLPTAIRVKTSSLALNICPPDLSVIGFGGWTLIEEDGDACHMEFRVGGKLAGYALSGAFAARANELYQRLIKERRSAMAVA